jgi:hypothetical protein
LPPDRRTRPLPNSRRVVAPHNRTPSICRPPHGIKNAHHRRPWVSPPRLVPPLTISRSTLLSPRTSGPSWPLEGHHHRRIRSRHRRFLPSPVSYSLWPLSARILGDSPFILSSRWCRTSMPTIGHRLPTGNAAAHRHCPSLVPRCPGDHVGSTCATPSRPASHVDQWAVGRMQPATVR